MSETRRPVYAIVGPTAVGKTRVGFELAKRLGAEIISVDSRQVYRYLDVGTDKISAAERRIVPHHLIDVVDPDEVFTAADFVSRTEDAVRRIEARGRTAILAGGTPLYYRALEGRVLSKDLPSDGSLRSLLEEEARALGVEALHERLALLDPPSAARIHPNDRVRIVRALEICQLTGERATEVYNREEKIGGAFPIFYFGIISPRELLYERIERRVAEQFASGYPEEVRWLLEHGYARELPALQGFGYRELVKYLDGEISWEEALAGDIRATKAFSRRQMSWFRHFSPIVWYDLTVLSMNDVVEDMIEKVTSQVHNNPEYNR